MSIVFPPTVNKAQIHTIRGKEPLYKNKHDLYRSTHSLFFTILPHVRIIQQEQYYYYISKDQVIYTDIYIYINNTNKNTISYFIPIM